MTGYESKKEMSRDKLAQPVQEPVAWLCKTNKHGLFDFPTPDKACKDCFPVYTAPPQRPWVGLTKKEQLEIFRQLIINPVSEYKIFKAYEKALKEKNT